MKRFTDSSDPLPLLSPLPSDQFHLERVKGQSLDAGVIVVDTQKNQRVLSYNKA